MQTRPYFESKISRLNEEVIVMGFIGFYGHVHASLDYFRTNNKKDYFVVTCNVLGFLDFKPIIYLYTDGNGLNL